jgi:hypothetical protein
MVMQVVNPEDQNGGSRAQGSQGTPEPGPQGTPNKNFLFTDAIVNLFKKIFLWIKNLFK